MRKSIFGGLLLLVVLTVFYSTSGCTDKKPAQDTVSVDTTASADTLPVDTMSSIIEEAPMPKAADELFDDFIFNFAANRKLQRERIAFPLPVYSGRHVSRIERRQWRMERFFMTQEFYTLIFDTERQMEVVKDTTVDSVIIEKIRLDKDLVKQYKFSRRNGQWMLVAITNASIEVNANGSFLKFYHRFVSDSTFQAQSVADPLTFTGPDPDDDFATITGMISPEQWPSFAPPLPANMLYNIIYGQKCKNPNQKILVIRGIANGLETQLTFHRESGRWLLVKLTT